METRKFIQWIVFIVIIAVATRCNTAFAIDSVIYGGTFNLPIADSNGQGGVLTRVAIDVPDHFDIIDLDVRINITHTHVFDLQLILESPQGTRLCLNMYNFDEFFFGANYTNTVFDDEATMSISDEQAEPPFTDSFRPRGPGDLHTFDGQNAFGTWFLDIYDMWTVNKGTLDSCELIFEIPEPSTTILFILGASLMHLRKKL